MVTKPTLLELLHEQHPDVPNLFSVYLSNDPSDSQHPSHLLFGAYDLGIVGDNATWHYTPVIKRGFGDFKYWTVKMYGMQVVADETHASSDLCADGCYAIVDSGTSGLAVPEDSYDASHSHTHYAGVLSLFFSPRERRARRATASRAWYGYALVCFLSSKGDGGLSPSLRPPEREFRTSGGEFSSSLFLLGHSLRADSWRTSLRASTVATSRATTPKPPTSPTCSSSERGPRGR